MTTEQQALIVDSLPRVRGVVHRLMLRMPWAAQTHELFEDLQQEGVIGLIQSIDRFDPSNGAAFWTFAHTRVEGAMLDALRRIAGRSRNGGSCVYFVSLPEGHASHDRALDQSEAVADVESLLEHLPPRESNVVRRSYLQEHTMREIGQSMGVNGSRVSQLRTRAVQRMRARVVK